MDAAIAAEDKNLAALGRKPVNLYERGKKTAALKTRLNNSRAYGYDPKDPKNIRAERAFKAKQLKTKPAEPSRWSCRSRHSRLIIHYLINLKKSRNDCSRK